MELKPKKLKVNGETYFGKEYGNTQTNLSEYDFPDEVYERYYDGDDLTIFEVEEDVFDKNGDFVETRFNYILSESGFNRLFETKEEMFEYIKMLIEEEHRIIAEETETLEAIEKRFQAEEDYNRRFDN